MNSRSSGSSFTILFGLLLVLGIILLPLSVRIVDQSRTCAIIRLGKVVGEAAPGVRLVFPFVTSFECYPATSVMFQTGQEANDRADYWDFPVEIKTSDGQTGLAMFNILYSVDPSQVVYVRSSVAQSEESLNERIVANFARSVPRDVAALFTADGLYATSRAEYAQAVHNLLAEKYAEFGVILVSFDLRDIQFSEDYEDAIEQQQIAEEGIETAGFVTEQKREEAEQARIAAQGRADSVVIEAQAEAEALELVAQALAQNPNIVQYEYVKRLAPNMSVMVLPAGQELIYALPQAAP